jgi:hypothetical protein
MQFTPCHLGVFAAANDLTGGPGAATRPRGARREVVVGGRRVKTIDVHAHCVIPEAQALLGMPTRDTRFGRGIEEVGAQRLSVMDEQGIDVEALSINPTWYSAERDVASTRIDLWRLRQWRSSFRTWRLVSWSTASNNWDCAAPRSAQQWLRTSSPIRSSTRSGPRPRSWAF